MLVEFSDERSQILWQLREKATSLVRQGQAQYQFGVTSLFQVVVLDSFEPPVSWEVCRSISVDKPYTAVQCRWREDFDLEQLEEREKLLPIKRKYLPSLEPTIGIHTIELPELWCQTMMDKLKAIHIPLYCDGVIRDESGQEWVIADGVSYELAFEAGYVAARFQWHEEAPQPWQVLEDFVQEVLAKIDTLDG